MRRHILPRVAGPVIVSQAVFAGIALTSIAGVNLLGLGFTPPTPTWGGMLANGFSELGQQSWLIVPSGVLLGLTVLAFLLLGDAIRDATVGRWAEGSGVDKDRAETVES